MKEVVRANGDSALYLGEEGSLQQDFVYKLYNTDEYIRDTFLANDDFAEACGWLYRRSQSLPESDRARQPCRG